MNVLQSSTAGNKVLSRKIEESIEFSIRNKQYLQGQKLPTEGEFCTLFSVSRTAVREALRRLSARGLVEIRQGSGAFVSEMSASSAIDSINLYLHLTDDGSMILNTIKARQLFEPEIASVAALQRTDKEVALLEENMNELKNCALTNIESETEIDNQFHLLISKASHNPIVSLLMEPVFNPMPKFKKSIFAKNKISNLEKEKQLLIHFHEGIFTAIRNKDSREAFYMMREHLKRSENNYMASLL